VLEAVFPPLDARNSELQRKSNAPKKSEASLNGQDSKGIEAATIGQKRPELLSGRETAPHRLKEENNQETVRGDRKTHLENVWTSRRSRDSRPL